MDAWFVPNRADANACCLRVVAELPAELSARLFTGDGAKFVRGWGQRLKDAAARK